MLNSKSFLSLAVAPAIALSSLTAPTTGHAAQADVQVDTRDQESWNAHFQTTYVRQTQPSFHSPYEGANSLHGAAGASYSITGTASLGIRLGPSTEAYVDPEVAQGVPLSGLVGMAAFTNGELAKTSGAQLKLYPARLFVRQTVELGGESTRVDDDANQLKSVYDSRRLVITAGKLSVLDLFDNNGDAHDPRAQFMNWVLMTYGAYDYPADARGYTNGLALEFDDGSWSARFGRFSEPKTPNGLPLDNHLNRHYGDQLELSHTYDIGGRPGAVRLLGFRSRAVMARYDDALAAAPAGVVPTLDDVRDHAQIKTGIGVNAEQQLGSDVSLFLRAMRADGQTETYAFTESDESFSGGLSVKGARWSRANDTVGLAGATDVIDAAHREYMARGGQTSFLGDGALRYGSEHLVELFYNADIGHGFALTADYQHVVNPGYNMDRGPVSFYALRLHWEN